MEDWKRKTLDKLRDYGLQKVALESIPHELKRLEIESVSIHSATADGTPVNGGGSRREERLLWNFMQQEDLKRNLEMAKEAVAFVDSGLTVLDDNALRAVKQMYIYPERGAVERLRNEWGLEDPRTVYKRLDKILYKLSTAMYGFKMS